jgi:NADH-quinone oxidoreductase subunit H
MFQLYSYHILILALINILFVLIAVAYYTLAERKIMAAIQRRRGPNVVGIWGLLQPLADGLKALLKEVIIPRKSNKVIFLGAPLLTLILSLAGWIVIPFNMSCFVADINLGLLYLFALSSLNVYSIIFAGWSSNSKYAFLGGLRSAAQMISYEVALGLIILPVVLCAGSFNLTDIVLAQRSIWFIFPLFPLAIIFFISSLAETNRAPFDLPEAEAELVAGYNVEYSSITFAMFFLGEYSNMLIMSSLNTILFLGGWLAPFNFLTIIPEVLWFALKVTAYSFVFVWVRAAFPRFRYDQLMNLGWKIFLPITLSYFLFISGILFSSGSLYI